MAATLTVPDEALDRLRPLFSKVEGGCEAWTDAEILTRMLIRGVMAYGSSAGMPFAETSELAAALRQEIAAA